MTPPRNDEIQYSLVSYLKGKSEITDELYNSSDEEVREQQWQGTGFKYPNVRVRIISNSPISEKKDCSMTKMSIGIQVHSEEASSQQCNQIAGIISSVLHAQSFNSQGLQISLATTNLIPAYRSDTQTWRSEVLMIGTVSG